MAGRNPGRPSKGERKRVEVRMPVPLADLLEKAAALNGQDVTEWVNELVAARLGYPYPGQERISLTEAA